jgi:two-component system nitrogen regulation response regulator GlnG
MSVLVRHRWPGNVRELENVIYRSAVIAQGETILLKDLPAEIREAVAQQPLLVVMPPHPAPAVPVVQAGERAAPAATVIRAAAVPTAAAAALPGGPTIESALDYIHSSLAVGPEPILERLEREMIVRVLSAEGGNQAKAAEKLGMTRATLRKRIGDLGLKI